MIDEVKNDIIFIDTQLWINIFQDKTKAYTTHLGKVAQDKDIVLTRFQQLELLKRCSDQESWELLSRYLSVQEYLDMTESSWQKAAYICYTLHQESIETLDCCMAQIAIENRALLIHNKKSFITISKYFPLQEYFLNSPRAY